MRKDHPRLSLSSFAREADIPFWRLRDARQQEIQRTRREKQKEERQERIREMALRYPTCGYRSLYALLRQECEKTGERCPGRHEVRLTLAALELSPPLPRKTRKQVAGVVPAVLWPAGRRIGNAPENPSSGFKRLSHFQKFNPRVAVPQDRMRTDGVVPGAELSA